MSEVITALKEELKKPDINDVGKESLVWSIWWAARLLKAIPKQVGENMNDVMMWAEQAIYEKAERDFGATETEEK